MISSFRYKQFLKAAQWIWAAFVFLVHVAPLESERASRFDFPFADKWVHAFLFFLLGALSYLARDSKQDSRQTMYWVIGVCACYGGLLEWVQHSFTDERAGDLLDWVADLAGTCSGLMAARFVERRITLRS
jgi:VanZ family protein